MFGSLEDARQGFREYTGFSWTAERRWREVGNEEYSDYYGECDVFEGEFGIGLSTCLNECVSPGFKDGIPLLFIIR